MDTFIEILLEYGYNGMFVAAFLAGSVFPFSSEAVLTGLSLAGLNVWVLIAYSTLGNTLGGMFNYSIGRIGKEEWIYRLFKVKENRMEQAQIMVHKYGAWMGLLSWLPILGSVITLALGLLHIHIGKALLSTFIGKFVRYIILGFIIELL